MTHMAMSLLGTFEVTLDGAAVTAFESTRVRALLAYLAVEADRPHSRDALAGLLWPDQPQAVALKNLRNALANLRTAIHDREAQPPFLLISRAAIQFNSASDYRLDVHDFRLRESEAGRQPDPHSEIQNLESKISLYRGRFLDGVAVDSPEFEAWQVLWQGQLESQFLATLQRLAALHEVRGEYEPAMACARRQLDLVPWDESAHRRLMRLLALTGQRTAALAQYRACRRLLAAEMGVEPAPETVALYEGLRSARRRPRVETGPPPAGPAARPSPAGGLFVAREGELAVLHRHLDQALDEQGRVVLVRGEAGSGKTCLLAEFARQTGDGQAGLVVAGGQCNEYLSQGDPYLPFREILQQLTGDVAGRQLGSEQQARRLWNLLPVAAQCLLAEGPDLIDRLLPGEALAVRAEAFAPGGAAWRTRLETLLRERGESRSPVPRPLAALLEQATRVLLAIACQRPLVLWVDDLQWADAGSLSLLFHLSRRLAQATRPGSRLLVVGAYRPHDLLPSPGGVPHPLTSLVRELRRTFGEIEIDLDRAAGRPFVDALLDTEPNALGEPFRAALDRTTGGHALFTIELLREMRQRGSLVRDEAGRWTEGPDLDWSWLPARVEAVIAGQTDRLPAAQLALLSAAGVEGETFSAEVLAGALGRDEAQVLVELNGPLVHAGLVHAQGLVQLKNGQRLSRYRFRHALFQAYLYGGLNPVERTRLHEAVGTALERLYGEGAAEVAAQLARHFQAAGLADKAVDYLLLAGQRAGRMFASQEAIDLYWRGLTLLETRPDDDARARREMDLQLALHAALRTVYDTGAPEQSTALARALQLGQHLSEPDPLLPVLLSLFDVAVAQGKLERARTFAQQLLSLAEQAQEPGYIVQGYRETGLVHFLFGNLKPGREQMEKGLAAYRGLPPATPGRSSASGLDAGMNILVWLSSTLWLLGYPDQSLACNSEALALVSASPHPTARTATVAAIGIGNYTFCRQFTAIREQIEWLQRQVQEKSLPAYGSWASFFQGWLLAHRGRAEEGLAHMQASMPAIQAMRPYRLTQLAGACLLAGQIDAGLQALDEALALAEQTGARSFEAEMRRLRGELLLRKGTGRREEAQACSQQAVDIARRQGAKSWELRATMSLARLWAEDGRTEQAHAALAAVYSWFTEGFDTPDLVEARALLAEFG